MGRSFALADSYLSVTLSYLYVTGNNGRNYLCVGAGQII